MLEIYLASVPELSLLFIPGYCRSVRCQDKPTSCQENVRFGCSAGMCKNLFVVICQRTGLGFERSEFEPCVDQHPEPVESEVVRACLCFAVIRYVIVPENSKSIFPALLAFYLFLLRALIG